MTTTTATRTNQYAATCVDCHQHVPAGTGILSQSDGRWIVQHTDCTTANYGRGTGWSDAAIRRSGGSPAGARVGHSGRCLDCGNRSSNLVRGMCAGCRDEY